MIIKIIPLALATLVLSAGSGKAIEAAADIKFQRTEVTSALEIGKRHRTVKEPLIYSRIQPYDLYNNYLHKWIDRPLFLNREWREMQDGKDQGFLKDIQLAKEYGIDGFTILGNAYQNRYKNYLNIIERNQPSDFSFMPGLAWRVPAYDRFLKNAQDGIKSKYSPRINGKVPFFSYGSIPLPEINTIRAKLAKDGCEDILLFDDVWLDIFGEYNNGKKLSAETLAGMQAKIQEKLDLVDGLILANYNMYRNPLGDYTLSKRFYFDLDKDYVAPVFEKVYDEEKNREKLLGFNVRHGYINHMAGVNEAETGTEQLRQALDTALLYNPDIISLVEWNEANENTSFQPTVYNAKALQRIIKCYASKMKNAPLRPNEGDNLSVPNLIVSSRQVVQLGEKYRIELLNVPDSDSEKSYTAQLTLKDETGKIIKAFKPDNFKCNNLTAVTYTLATEQITGARAVSPELTIVNGTDAEITLTSLTHTRIVPSFCLNCKEVRLPLRDLLVPEKSNFELAKINPDQSLTLTGSIASPEPLVSLEILDNDDEVFAVDRANEFKLADNYLFLAGFSTKQGGTRNLKIEFAGTDDFIFKPWSYPYAGFGQWAKTNNLVSGKLLFWADGVKFLLSIPRNHQKDVAIKFEIEGLKPFQIAVSDIVAKGKYGAELAGHTFFQIEHMRKLADHPVNLNTNKAVFSATVSSEFKAPCFQVRAITQSGKIYRSKPLLPEKHGDGKEPAYGYSGAFSKALAALRAWVRPTASETHAADKESYNVFSCTLGKAVAVDWPADEIIDINYAFTPEYGTVLRDLENPFFDAKLGGGFKYLDPLRFGSLPDGVSQTAPSWVKSDDQWMLRFDGKGNYLVLPPGTIPNGPFTLEFECKTESGANQALFRQNSLKPGSILLYIIDGKLQAEFASMGRNYGEKIDALQVNLDFPANKWVKVKAAYNLHSLVFEVDGKSRKIPFNLRAARMTASIFGGFSSDDKDIKDKNLKFFQGDLRSLHIRHNAD